MTIDQLASSVAAFPRRYFRRPLDAYPIGRERHIHVQPDGFGAWQVIETTDDGASCLRTGASKTSALRLAFRWVLNTNATMSVENGEPSE